MPSISLAQGSSPTECDSLLNQCAVGYDHCTDALKARSAEAATCELGLKQTTDQLATLNSQIQTKDKQLESTFRNPFVMTTLGVVLGILVTGYALRGK